MTVIPVVFVALIASLCTKTAAETLSRPPSIDKQPGFEQLYRVSSENKHFALECEASGNPEPKIVWFKNEQLFDYTVYEDRISQEPKNGTLVFLKPESIDEGVYQCFAENIHGTAVSNKVFLRKSELNSFIDDLPYEKYVVEGDPLTLDCARPAGYPEPVILWVIIQNGGGLRTINSSRLTVDPNGSLHFSNVTMEDILLDGTYACSAPSFFKDEYKIGKRVFLRLEPNVTTTQIGHALVKNYVSPERIAAFRGQKLDLHCIYGGTPLPGISWKKDGLIAKGNRYTYINFGKTLQIKAVDFEDEGTYECTANNGVGMPESNTMTVSVESVPFWITYPNSTNVDDGEDVRFECIAGGVPEPDLQWFVNGKILESAPPNSRRKVDGNVLIIENVVKTDTAVYQCNASNVHGYAFKDFYVNVLALPPSIIEKPKGITRAFENSTTILKCRAYGAPKPEIKWLRDRLDLKGDRYYVFPDGDLRISNVSRNDDGVYTCVARNKFGEAFEKGELEVEYYITSGVTNLSVVTTESTSHLAKTDWLIGMLCVIALVIILAILVCIVKRNRGGKYSVHEKEAALGKDMDYDEPGFDEYSKPVEPRNTGNVGSRSSLTSSLKNADGHDADSMTDYGDDDSSKFGEDGSFIGEYGKKKNSNPQPPTFV